MSASWDEHRTDFRAWEDEASDGLSDDGNVFAGLWYVLKLYGLILGAFAVFWVIWLLV